MDTINDLATLLGTFATLGVLTIDLTFFQGQLIIGPAARFFGVKGGAR